MADSIKIRAKQEGDEVQVKCLISHPMETGLRKDKKTGEVVPAHYITEVTAEIGGKKVLVAQWGGGVSTNPYLAFAVKGAKKGDAVKVSWVDNKGEKDAAEAAVG